jgi:hypothetical protein
MQLSFQTPRHNSSMQPAGVALGSLAAGAALAYLFDPQSGARRRARLKQRAARTTREVASAVSATASDLSHRATGSVAEIRDRVDDARDLLRGRAADDDVLIDRVRARLGRLSRHPSAIEVHAHNGQVTLMGPILRAELGHVLHGVRQVRGVRDVTSQLRALERAGTVQILQGGRPRRLVRRNWFEARWSPTARLLAGATGVGLLRWGTELKGLPRAASTAAGLALLLRSFVNLPTRPFVGISGGRRTTILRSQARRGQTGFAKAPAAPTPATNPSRSLEGKAIPSGLPEEPESTIGKRPDQIHGPEHQGLPFDDISWHL